MASSPSEPGAAIRDAAPSLHTGMGAISLAGGTSFRVWATFAQSVAVAGTLA
jgi:hypothetical protein